MLAQRQPFGTRLRPAFLSSIAPHWAQAFRFLAHAGQSMGTGLLGCRYCLPQCTQVNGVTPALYGAPVSVAGGERLHQRDRIRRREGHQHFLPGAQHRTLVLVLYCTAVLDGPGHRHPPFQHRLCWIAVRQRVDHGRGRADAQRARNLHAPA